jgi:hypothetical protein
MMDADNFPNQRLPCASQVRPMSKWLKPLLFGIWGLLLIPPAATAVERWLAEEKWLAENVLAEPNLRLISDHLIAIGEQLWFKFALVFMTGAVVGMSLEMSARRSGERKAFELRSLGYKFRTLSNNLKTRTAPPGWPDNARELKPALTSVLITARKFALWAPGERLYDLPDASFLCEYFSCVGHLLEDGRLDEARREALSWKPFLDRANAKRS